MKGNRDLHRPLAMKLKNLIALSFPGLNSFTVSSKAVKLGASATFTCLTAGAPSPKTFIYKGGHNVNAGGVKGKQISADEVSFLCRIVGI